MPNLPDKTPVASLDGVYLNALPGVGWVQQTGCNAPQWTVEVSASRDVKLNENCILKLGDKEIKRLTVLDKQAGSAPFTYTLTLTDRRWRWPSVWVERSYNVRMPTGTNVVKGPRDENVKLIPGLQYNRYTLKNETAVWTLKEVIKDVLEQMGIADYHVWDPIPEVPVEDLHLRSYGNKALQDVLDLCPSLTVQQYHDGSIVVQDASHYQPAYLLSYYQKYGKISTRGDYPRLVDNQLVRPIRVEVLLEVEPELRLAFREDGSQAFIPMVNVIEVPDFELTLADGSRVAQGTFVQIDTYLAALALQDRPHSESPVLTQQLIREGFLNGFKFLKALYHVPGGGVDPLWNARFDRLLRDWRQLFRVSTEWKHRLAHLRAIRATLVDRPTGNRAVAEAFANYVVRPSWRGFSRKRSTRHDQGYAIEGFAELLADAKTGPFTVTVEDDLAGLIRITPRVDPYHEADDVAPGYVSDYNIPRQAFGANNQLKEGFYALWERVTLDANWKLDAVLTGTAQTPNTSERLYRQVVDPGDLKDILPELGTCDGPVQQLRIPPSVMTARFRWTDEEGATVLQNLKSAVHWNNLTPHNAEHVKNVALAAAAAFYTHLLDRVSGSVDITGDEGGLVGNEGKAYLRLNPDGSLRTQVQLHPFFPAADLMAYLPKVTQDIVAKRLYDEGR